MTAATPDEGDVQRVAVIVSDANRDPDWIESLSSARAILTSDWLRERDARVAAEALRSAATYYADHPWVAFVPADQWLRERADGIKP